MARPLDHRTDIILFFGQAQRNIHETVRLFNEAHPERPVVRKYVRESVNKFLNSGSVNQAPRSGRPSVLTEEVQVDILADFALNPIQSIRTVAETHEISYSTTRKVLKINKFHPYKIQLHQELNEDDPDRRVQFCQRMLELIEDDRDILMRICFSDESTFHLNGALNRHNCRYWSDTNPHEFREGNTQYPQKLNVWAGILGDRVVGPFFLNENLTGERYLEMLQDEILPAIAEIVEDGPNPDANIIFQQDGAPPHFSRVVREFLDDEFPRRWIGRRGFVEWPPRSPDMTPLDFFLWGHLKSEVYEPPPENLNVLRQRILDECRKITPNTFRKVRQCFEARLYYCQEVEGLQFEQLLN
jgi:hypothetical protein